jgi:SAM-dependent methyltransferase
MTLEFPPRAADRGRAAPPHCPPLVCPIDHTSLVRSEESDGCPQCGRRYPIEAGVVRFLAQEDEFYESHYLGDRTVRWVPRRDLAPWSWPLWLMKSGYVWAVRRHVPAGQTVLEIGCASGIRYLSERYRTIGLDLSATALARVAGLYDACLQVDLTQGIPLPDGSIDAVISSFVWEHIQPEHKPAVLAELRRVLRPGGKLVFLYDVDSRHPLYLRMRAVDPARFQEVLIDREGHAGWQNAADNAASFAAAGFRVIEHRGQEKLLIGPAMYHKMAEWPGAFARWARIGLRFELGWRFHLYNAANRLLDETVGRWLPASWARVMVTVCERTPNERGRT